MTFEEAKKALAEIKREKRRMLNIRRDLNEAIENLDALTLRPSVGGEKVQSQAAESTVERVVLRLEVLRERFAKALQRVMDMEDKLAAAIEDLSPIEQEIIIGNYLRNKTHDRLAYECGYSARHIKRIKHNATIKICSKL